MLRTAGRPPFTVVLDREDDVRFTRTPAHDVMAGRVVVHPTVGGSGRLLWHDVLHAVADGRHPCAPARPTRGDTHEQEHAVLTAFEAAAVRQLTVLRAHRIGWVWWAELIRLHRTTRTDSGATRHAAPGPNHPAAPLRPPRHHYPRRSAGPAPARHSGIGRLNAAPHTPQCPPLPRGAPAPARRGA